MYLIFSFKNALILLANFFDQGTYPFIFKNRFFLGICFIPVLDEYVVKSSVPFPDGLITLVSFGEAVGLTPTHLIILIIIS